MTFHDNDFTDILERFASKLCVELMVYDNVNNHDKKILPILNNQYTPSDKEKEKIVQIVKSIFNRIFDHHKSFQYLSQELEVSIVQEISEKWENGEVVYLSTTNNKFLTF